MRLVWLTDIHMNFLRCDEATAAFYETIVRETPDALVVTGDISVSYRFGRDLKALHARVRCPVFFVLGNYDFLRFSVDRVYSFARDLTAAEPNIVWLTEAGVVELCPRVALVGVEGWGDFRIGNWETTDVIIHDFNMIDDLSRISRAARVTKLRELGDRDAERLSTSLLEACARYPEVMVATHVPPFREACLRPGGIASENWLPLYTCKATGDVLLEAMSRYPECGCTVLCGHAHGGGEVRIRPNLEVRVGAARYGKPRIAGVLEVGNQCATCTR